MANRLDLDSIGRTTGPREVWWNSSHCLLYAVAVGCGPEHLQFVTENSLGVQQRVLPTFVCTVGEATALFAQRPGEHSDSASLTAEDPYLELNFGRIDTRNLRHAGERLEVHAPLPVEANVRSWSTVTGIWDKGHAAVIDIESRAHDAATDQLLYSTRHSLFVQGAGGFGGERGPADSAPAPPERAPDDQVTYETSPNQTYLYRLAYGRHPLHSDPEFARQSGLDEPILAGMCTYGFTGRALLEQLCGGDPSRFLSMEGRFSAPVRSGDSLTVKLWVDGSEATFVTETQRGDVAISHGHCRFT